MQTELISKITNVKKDQALHDEEMFARKIALLLLFQICSMKFKIFLFQPPVYFGKWTFNNVMLSMPINCRRNLNCVRGEKVAFHGPILLYQFAIIKLTRKLLLKGKVDIKYQLSLQFPGIPIYLLYAHYYKPQLVYFYPIIMAGICYLVIF